MGKIISFWKEKLTGKDENSPAFRKSLAQRINHAQLKYVSERINNVETVVCHKAVITLAGDDILISSPDKGTVYRSVITETKMSELLSKEGIIFTGNDSVSGKEERTVIAYYTYYRKV